MLGHQHKSIFRPFCDKSLDKSQKSNSNAYLPRSQRVKVVQSKASGALVGIVPRPSKLQRQMSDSKIVVSSVERLTTLLVSAVARSCVCLCIFMCACVCALVSV